MGDIPGSGRERKFMKPVNSTPGRKDTSVFKTSDAGIDLIKKSEGFKDRGYYATDQEAKDGLVTVGYGSTRRVKHGEKIDEAQGEQFLREDLASAEKDIDRLVKVPLKQNERDALVSLVFNVGAKNLGKSKALKALNAGDRDTFMLEAFSDSRGFVKQNGKVLDGLVTRRKAEQDLFIGDAGPTELEDSSMGGVVSTDSQGRTTKRDGGLK